MHRCEGAEPICVPASREPTSFSQRPNSVSQVSQLDARSSVSEEQELYSPERAKGTAKDVAGPGPGSRRKGIHISGVVNFIGLGLGAAACWTGWQAKALKAGGGFLWAMAAGGVAGLELSKRYKRNRRNKSWKLDFLGLPLGERGIFKLLNPNDPFIPNLTQNERVEFLNKALRLMWPFYEPAVVKIIKENVTPRLEAWKPSYIKSICFHKLTFGDVPFYITGVEVLEDEGEEFVLQAAIRWHGSANISLLVETGGVKVQPRVERLDFFANVRVAFTPLVPSFPGFGAMTLAFLKPPLVRFEISVGTPLLEFNSDTVKEFLTNFLVNHVFGDLLVWPNRIVVPILPEDVRGPIDHLYLHTRGVVQVQVKEAEGLGDDDDDSSWRVLLQTVINVHNTEACPGTHPVWEDEEHYLKVQELSQRLSATIVDDHYDHSQPCSDDRHTPRRGRKIGSCYVDFTDLEPGKTTDEWYDVVGTGSIDGEDGQSSRGAQGGFGPRLRLGITYMPLDWLRRGRFCNTTQGSCDGTHHGLLFFRLLRGYNLPQGMKKPYCEITLFNEGTNTERPVKKSRPVKHSFLIEWNESFEWFNICVEEVMIIKVFDCGKYKNKPVGTSEILLSDVALAMDPNHREDLIETIELERGKGDLEVEFDWVPLDHNPIHDVETSSDSMTMQSRCLLAGQITGVMKPNFCKLKHVCLPRGRLHVKLMWAQNLHNVDWLGKSDPYVQMSVKGNKKQSSVINNNLNPVWEEVFVWRSVKATDVLEFDIWDRGTISDTALARCDIEISVAANHPGEVMPVTQMLLSPDMTEKEGGTITVQLHFQPLGSSGDLKMEPDWQEMHREEWECH